MNFSIRKADINDCSRIRELASRIWEPTYGSILSEEQLEYMFEMMYSVGHIKQQMTELKHEYLIAYADDEPAGYIAIEKKSDDVFIFQKIYTLPELHGKGFGRYLMEQGTAYIKSIHPLPFTVELYVNRENPAVGFYEHLGMKKIATRDHDIGHGFYMNDYIMAMKIE
ncbi:MAG: GNAT family N-acetyltransferase [Tannerella sp.]|jgi:ribosomal protein S18 acetylase RimI-like enzyme|nr:GNAT family N-acetyltransferase [Tannerella sp.]